MSRWKKEIWRSGDICYSTGMKVHCTKTCVNESDAGGMVKVQGVENTAQLFREVVEFGKQAKKRVQAGWTGWRRVSGVICERRVEASGRGKVYKIIVLSAFL